MPFPIYMQPDPHLWQYCKLKIENPETLPSSFGYYNKRLKSHLRYLAEPLVASFPRFHTDNPTNPCDLSHYQLGRVWRRLAEA